MAPKLITFLSREFLPPPRPPCLAGADVEAMLERMRLGGKADASLSALEASATIRVQEGLDRMQSLDAKALSILGWTSAVAALFLARGSSLNGLEIWQTVLFAIGAAAALLAVIASYMVIRVRRVGWPSQRDWIREDLLTRSDELRVLHLRCWHHADSVNSLVNWKKGVWLRWAQFGMIVGAVCAAVALLFALLS